MIALAQILIKYFLFKPFNIDITLNWFGFSLLVLATVCLAAAGNIINDIYDVEADRINKPNRVVIGNGISEKAAYNLFLTLNIIGVLIGFYLSNMIGKPLFSAIFILISALLYLYATFIKGYVVIGNLVISALVALSIIIVGLYELLPVITPQNQATQTTIFSILLDYAFFAFLVNWIREMVKDQEDIDGDYKSGIQTLPIVFGRERTNKLIFAISFLSILTISYYIITYFYTRLFAIGYALLFIVGPLLYFMFKILSAKTKSDYKKLSLLLKIVLFFGLISIGLYQFILL